MLDDLEVIRARLDAGLDPETCEAIGRLLAARVDVHTTVNPDGTKDAPGSTNHAFPSAVVNARTGTRAAATAIALRRAGPSRTRG